MSVTSKRELRLFAWRHANAAKAREAQTSHSLINFSRSDAFSHIWETSENRKSLRDLPAKAIEPPNFMAAKLYGDPWMYVFVDSPREVLENDVVLHADAEIAMLWADLVLNETHFRYWKRGKLIVAFHASGIKDSDPIDVRSFNSAIHGRNPFKYDSNLGGAIETILLKLVINRRVPPPLTVQGDKFKLHGDPADYDAIIVTALNPLEVGDIPSSDQLREAINKGSVQLAKEAIRSGASLTEVPGLRSSPLGFACFTGHAQLVRVLIEAGCSVQKNSALIADSIVHFNPEEKVLKTVEVLAEFGASVNVADAHGMTPLHNAVLAKFPGVVRRLLELGADAHARDSLLSLTPLERAKDRDDSAATLQIISILERSE